MIMIIKQQPQQQEKNQKPKHETHLLKLVDMMCKYKKDPIGIVEDIKRTLCPQTDGRTRWNSIFPPQRSFNFFETGVL